MARRNSKVEEPVEADFEEEFDGEAEAADEHDLMEDLSFEEPPARTRSPRTGKWAKVLDALREHEGQWARIAVKAKSGTAAALAGNLRSGTLVGAEKGEFEVTSRRLPGDEEQYGVFARYNPNGADEQVSDNEDYDAESDEFYDDDVPEEDE